MRLIAAQPNPYKLVVDVKGASRPHLAHPTPVSRPLAEQCGGLQIYAPIMFSLHGTNPSWARGKDSSHEFGPQIEVNKQCLGTSYLLAA